MVVARMFCSQFKLSRQEEQGLCVMCVFTIKVYLKPWIEASFPTSAPENDIRLKMLQDYHDKRIGNTGFNKLSSYLWYLSEELVGLAFFDQELPDDIKRQYVVKQR